jgi:hypothetical protein
MTMAQREDGVLLEWVRADQEILAYLRPDEPFDARASFQAFGERQYGARFANVTCCCELPGDNQPRWEAALELRTESATEQRSLQNKLETVLDPTGT